ncbi:hypothetical protein SBA4_360026 [Candidatus Sulfopaludibacter sp. SbA4]|nr:hypothetical protein SBA4_360026 [Candidatus Sulfopaludibacter sp. SbA4]
MQMTDAELERLLADVESDRVERKESLADREKIREAIVTGPINLPPRQVYRSKPASGMISTMILLLAGSCVSPVRFRRDSPGDPL